VASLGHASFHPRCARAWPRGCGPARSTSGGGRRRCCAWEEGEGHRRRRVPIHTCGGITPSTPSSCRGRSAAPCAAHRSSSRAPRRWRRPLAAEGSGRPPCSGASLQAQKSGGTGYPAMYSRRPSHWCRERRPKPLFIAPSSEP
jgi:hypothetical protein